MKSVKKPVPVVGDHVGLRGRVPAGRLKNVNSRKWCAVEWTTEEEGPKLVHLDELELRDNGGVETE